ncbi:hypothetical protein [Melghirimyces algeriensis]|uniref:Uncharacterized protein n=1 Tax=Melghirimyces algeriensis TaxID=910412 RepID=A0A521BN63_9BACL|nr:hypothetical protein [Melghirimyces algeriensis]SMO48587.1 hypothetical protein SAMN06264849_102240 [Melghirimyces algeriensis]
MIGSFQSMQKHVRTDSSRTVANVQVRLVVSDLTGTIRVTDLMLQGGSIATVWTGHASEITWSFDG